jgi:hypothetical protein
MTMSESKTSQVREAQAAWKEMVDDHLSRMELAAAELLRMQEQALAQNRQAIDDLAKLGKESVDYFGRLSASFCKLTLEATRKTAELADLQG